MQTFSSPTRVWINQPSSNQPMHKYHGMVAIAHTEPNTGRLRLYFTTGDVTSMYVSPDTRLETKNSQANVFKLSDRDS